MNIIDYVSFFEKFCKEPKKIGSIIPSSTFLTRKLLVPLPWNKIETIVELGSGTGVFTRFIAKHKKLSSVLLIEYDNEMLAKLKSRYPYPYFHFGRNAEQLCELLTALNLSQVDCIVSGLPFFFFTKEMQEKIIMDVKKSLCQDGIFVAFQYSLQLKPLLIKNFSKVQVSFEFLNIPPAFIFHCKK